jgi:hypothetical protein
MRAYIGNARDLQQALHSTVLTVLTVEHRENHIDGPAEQAVPGKAQQAVATDGRNGHGTIISAALPGTARQLAIVLRSKEEPLSLLGDTNRKDLILLRVQIVQNRLCRPQRHGMFRTHAAEQDTNIQLFHF